MGLLGCSAMRALEERAFQSGVSAEDLMNKAGRGLGELLCRHYPRPGTAVACLGRGNNAGDALVALRVLRDAGWTVRVRSPYPPAELGELPRRKLRELEGVEEWDGQCKARPLLLLDGLLGIGGRGSLRDPLASLAGEINRRRLTDGAQVVAVDLPSGLDGDTGTPAANAVRADLTVTIGVPKTGLVAESAVDCVGRLAVVPLSELPIPSGGDRLLVPEDLRLMMPPRPFHMHKGQAGRIGIVAGSRGLLGAAFLTAQGALRGGAGLTTLFVPDDQYSLFVAAGGPPELIIKPVCSYREVIDAPLDALVIGPGLGRPGQTRAAELLELIGSFGGPVVADADALNLLAAGRNRELLHPRLMATPHPGEMQRLFPEGAGLDRVAVVRRFVNRFPATLLLKGARTIIAAPESPLYYNSTGTPGMASGGQGDVLSGLLGALCGSGLDLREAACCGAWLAGRASELALAHREASEDSLLPTDTARFLGSAFRDLRGRP